MRRIVELSYNIHTFLECGQKIVDTIVYFWVGLKLRFRSLHHF